MNHLDPSSLPEVEVGLSEDILETLVIGENVHLPSQQEMSPCYQCMDNCRQLKILSGVVPQGFLAHLLVAPTLEDQIREAQLLDAMVKKVKIGIAKSQPKYKCYRLDDKDTLFFEDRIFVPKGD